MEFNKLELPAGEGQLIVMFVNVDTGAAFDIGILGNEVAADAAERRKQGWRLISVASTSLRQMGTAGNYFFHSGGQYATQSALMAVYSLV